MTADIPARRKIKIAHLYPEAMDLYGDIGNIITLCRRCEWRGIDVEVLEVRAGDDADLHDADLLVMGGGQDSAESYVASDLKARGALIRTLVDEGAAALVVCGGLQLFGLTYETASGAELEGIGVFNVRTTAGGRRYIGNIAIEAKLGTPSDAVEPETVVLVGFENHSGLTHVGGDTLPLGRVLMGAGNLGDGSVEGAIYKNAIGTYLHGPVLPKNPKLADHLIATALAHRYGVNEPLGELDDTAEMAAHAVALTRCETGRVAGPVRKKA
ncbi:MAG: glutamine amidotransferase [Coriobacteriia bacterium]|nr:glutamine amidotransferase [Coriobacteriia bacterium]